MKKISRNIIVVSFGIILGLALSGCQNPFLQLTKDSVGSSGGSSSEASPSGLSLGTVYTVSFSVNGGSTVKAITVPSG